MTTSLTPKERVYRAIRYEPVDHLPTQINYTPAAGKALADAFGISLRDLPDRLGNHILRVDLTYTPRISPDGKTRYDWWGAGFDRYEEGYFVNDPPLANRADLAAYLFPDPYEVNLMDEAAASIAADCGQHFVLPNFGFALFERAWSLRGFAAIFLDLAEDPIFLEDLLERITDIQVSLARRFIAQGVDGGYFGDDLGAQRNTLFSPRTWRKLFKPRLARMFAVFRDAGLPVWMHSDGDIVNILPDLVEIGLNVLNPVQPEVLDHAWLQRTFGKNLAYYGGVSTQSVLPHGTPGRSETSRG